MRLCQSLTLGGPENTRVTCETKIIWLDLFFRVLLVSEKSWLAVWCDSSLFVILWYYFLFCYFMQELLLKVPFSREWNPSAWAIYSHRQGILCLRLIHSNQCWLPFEWREGPWPYHGAGLKHQQRYCVTRCRRAQRAGGLPCTHWKEGHTSLPTLPCPLHFSNAVMLKCLLYV